MVEVKRATYITVDIPDPDAKDDDELDALSAQPVKDHYARGEKYTRWLVGHECSGSYLTIHAEEIPAWIELFNEMLKYKEEQ